MLKRTVASCIVLIAGLASYSMYDNSRWKAYAELNKCEPVGKTQAFFAFQPKFDSYSKQWSTAQIYYPSKTVFKCNNGKEYTR